MKMNRFEKMAMNNPVRSLLQKYYEAPLLEKLGGTVDGLRVLEIGCGQGVGTELLFKRFKAGQVVAMDIDPEMIERAEKRLSHYSSEKLKLVCGDVTRLDAPDESFDAVFDFAILHHVPVWQDAVGEIRRVLRPGGRFFFMEVTSVALNRWFYRTFLEHPRENRFSAHEFVAGIEERGIAIQGNFVERFRKDFVFGVGRRG